MSAIKKNVGVKNVGAVAFRKNGSVGRNVLIFVCEGVGSGGQRAAPRTPPRPPCDFFMGFRDPNHGCEA